MHDIASCLPRCKTCTYSFVSAVSVVVFNLARLLGMGCTIVRITMCVGKAECPQYPKQQPYHIYKRLQQPVNYTR